jgi:hypothetical protein
MLEMLGFKPAGGGRVAGFIPLPTKEALHFMDDLIKISDNKNMTTKLS